MTRRQILAAAVPWAVVSPASRTALAVAMPLSPVVHLAAMPLAAAVPDRPSIPLRLSVWPNNEESTAIAAKDLQISVNGKPAKLTRLGAPNDPLVLNIVLDLIGDLTLVEHARETLITEIEKTTAATALLRAQDGLRVLADPGSPKAKVTEQIRAVNISGRAGLLETIAPAATLADSILRGARVRAALLYITDGLITQYREDYTNPVVNSSDANDMSRRFPEGLVKEKIRQLKTELAATLVPIFIVHLNYQSDRLNEAYQTGLLDLAASSGGEAGVCRTVSDIAPAIARAFARIATLQVVEVDARLGKSRQFEFAMEAAGQTLHYRSRYVPSMQGPPVQGLPAQGPPKQGSPKPEAAGKESK